MATSRTINTFTDYSAAQQDIERRRRMAEMLQQQGMQPIEQQTAGGYVVPTSWTQGLAKMLQGYAGRKGLDEATARSKDLSGRRNQALAEALGAMPKATPGQPEKWTGAPEEPAVYTPQQPMQQPSMQQNAAWLGRLGQIGPDAVQMGGTVLGMQQKQDENALNRESKTLDRIMALEAAAIQAGATRESQAAARKEAEQLRRDLAADSDRRAREMQTSQQTFMANQNRQGAADRAALAGVGRVPPGYRQTSDGRGLEPIPGGPADTKVQGVLNADTAALDSSTAALNRLAEQANLVLKSKLGAVTGLMGAVPNIPGTEAADARGRLDALKSQVGFSVMQALRDAAKTGSSGLGQITEKEHVYLQQQLGNLDKAQSEKEIRRVVGDILKFSDDAKGRIRNAYNMRHKDKAGTAPSGVDALLEKYK